MVLLGKPKLNTIEVLVCKALINSNINHNEFDLVIDVLKKCNDMKEAIRMMIIDKYVDGIKR